MKNSWKTSSKAHIVTPTQAEKDESEDSGVTSESEEKSEEQEEVDSDEPPAKKIRGKTLTKKSPKAQKKEASESSEDEPLVTTKRKMAKARVCLMILSVNIQAHLKADWDLNFSFTF